MNETSSVDVFRARVGEQFGTPGEAADAFLERDDRMPDPIGTLGASFAVTAIAERFAEVLQDPHALYSPQQAGAFITDAAETIHALCQALPAAVELVHLARLRGDVPDGAKPELDAYQEAVADVCDELGQLGRRIRATADGIGRIEFAGYADQGRVHHLAEVVAGLRRVGARIDSTQVPDGDDDGVVEFTIQNRQYALADDSAWFGGWELLVIDGERFERVEMIEARSPAAHPAAIVEGALAAIRRRESSGAA